MLKKMLNVAIHQVLVSPFPLTQYSISLDIRWSIHGQQLICFTKSTFHTMKAIQNVYITLPNHERILKYFNGTVKNGSWFDAWRVLFVPQFKFNLSFFSLLTRDSSMIVRFLTDSCIIQDMPSLRMIGKGKWVSDLYVLDADPSNSVINIWSPTHETFDSVCSAINNITSHTCHQMRNLLSPSFSAWLKLSSTKD